VLMQGQHRRESARLEQTYRDATTAQQVTVKIIALVCTAAVVCRTYTQYISSQYWYLRSNTNKRQ
jgi:hypothetical protein